ncbi:MAG TPA: DUF1285 domain-containing protein [Smithellaceae bacterium]|nr:DUF1285 domain-containing protein [Smithellaceae bacterium]
MESSDIKIDKEGIWYYRGAHMFRKDILCILFENLKVNDCGQYFIELNDEICYLDVEDTAFVITAVYKTKALSNGHDIIEVLVSDDCREKLDLSTLAVGPENIMYCRIKDGKFPARFTRKSYYQLAEFIEQDDENDAFYIVLNKQKYMIENS